MTALPRPSEEHVAEYFRTMNERHAAYLRRAVGEPWPWSSDPVLSNWRFTNVFREIDATTVWIAQHWRAPYDGDPRLPFFMCVARQINSEDTLAALAEVGLPPDWDPDRVLEVLEARMARGEKTYTSPYRTALPQQAGDSKSRYLVQEVFEPLWRDPPAFETARSLEDVWHLPTPRRGFGGDGLCRLRGLLRSPAHAVAGRCSGRPELGRLRSRRCSWAGRYLGSEAECRAALAGVAPSACIGTALCRSAHAGARAARDRTLGL